MRRVFETLLAVFVFLMATAYLPGHPFGEIQGKVYQVGIASMFIFTLFLKPLRFACNKWVNGIVAVAFLTTLKLPLQPQQVAVEGLVYIFMGVALFYMVVNHVESYKNLFVAFTAIVVLDAFVVALQMMGMDPICLNDAGQKNSHLVGLFGFKYVFGAYMAIVAPFLLLNRRYVFGGLALLMAFLSMSWASVGAAMLALMVAMWFLNRKVCIGLVIAVMSLAMIAYFGYFKPRELTSGYLKDASHNYVVGTDGKPVETKVLHPASLPYKIKTRLELEAKFLPILFSKPVTGWGLGCFKYIGPTVNTYPYGTMTDAWNDYLERGIECGFGMVAMMIFLFVSTWRRFLNCLNRKEMIPIVASLLTVPVGICFHDYFNHFSLTSVMMVLLALYEITIKEKKDESEIRR